MDAFLINSFRDRVNEYGLIYHIYKNRGGKNKWSIICSAMDWIQVGVSGIDIETLEWSNTDRASVKLITFLACIDVMWEGIQQLHRVFYDTADIPFVGDKDVFHKEIDDNKYWKEIRAAFAAHPTNLDGKTEGERRYASWSGGGFGNSGDFSVIIYSNDPDKDFEYFDICINDILVFATKRYEYLKTIMKHIDVIIHIWCQDWEKRPIILTEDTLSNIKILLKENSQRCDNDYFEERLIEIQKTFEAEIHGEKNIDIVKNYQEALKREILTIGQFLQAMNFDCEYKPVVDESIDLEYVYENQQIFEPEKGMIHWAVERLKKPLGKYIEFDTWETIEELQVLVKAGWWIYHRNL